MQGFLGLDGAMWVATDIGLSRWDARSGWHHFLPDPATGRVLEASCVDIYRKVLATMDRLPQEEDWVRESFVRTVKRMYPAAARELAAPTPRR